MYIFDFAKCREMSRSLFSNFLTRKYSSRLFATFATFRHKLCSIWWRNVATFRKRMAKYRDTKNSRRDFSQANGEISRHKKFTSRLFACTSRKVATFRKACRDTKNSRRDFSQGVSRHKKSGCRKDGVFINKIWRLLSPSRLFANASNFRRDFSPFVSRLFAICVAT